MSPVRSQHSFGPEPNSLGKEQRGHVLDGHQGLEPLNVQSLRAPTCEHSECFRCDPSPTSPLDNAASELAHLMVIHHDHDLAQVGITRFFGDHQVEQLIVTAVLLEEFDDTSRIICR